MTAVVVRLIDRAMAAATGAVLAVEDYRDGRLAMLALAETEVMGTVPFDEVKAEALARREA